MLRDTAGEGRLQPNPFPLLRFFNPSVLRTPPLYFAVQNTEEEGILDFVAVAADVFFTPPSFNPLALRALPLYSL